MALAIENAMVNYPLHLNTFLQRMRSDESFHDVVFVVEGERFPANRCVVASASPVLRQMLMNGMKETEAREIPLHEVHACAWRKVLGYMYSAQIDLVNVENALLYLECANRFQVEELEHVISSYIVQQLDIATCAEILVVVDRINFSSLREMALATIVRNFYKFYSRAEFVKLRVDLVLEILRCRDLVVRSEIDVFHAGVRWFLGRKVGGNDSVVCVKIMKQARELFQQIGVSVPDFEDTAVSSACGDECGYEDLFNCVDVDRLSDDDLRRVIRFCRNLCKQAKELHNVHLGHLQQLGERAMEKLLEFDNSVANVPILPCDRVPHGRDDQLFTFSARFSCLHADLTFNQESALFVEKSGKAKWKINLNRQDRYGGTHNSHLACYLTRSANKSCVDDNVECSTELFVVIEKGDDDVCKSTSAVFSKCEMNASLTTYATKRRGYTDLVPISVFEGKKHFLAGAAIYTKSK